MKTKRYKIRYKGKIGANDKMQDSKSLAVMLREYDSEGHIPFHMPGHKRAEYNHLSGVQGLDITEIEGFDNLHNAKGILFEAQKKAAAFFGANESRFLTCGSTAGAFAAIRTLTHSGDEVLIARNCHRSVYNAAEICNLKPFYVTPSYFEEYGFYGSVMPADVDKAFKAHPNIKLVVITSPTYEGIISDIKAIAVICRANGAKLFVDEAHGAHLGLSKKFAESARYLGADIVLNSFHKTLPSLTQTALLHVCSSKVDVERLDKNLAIFQTSSPSYVLMASIEGCVRYLQGDGVEVLDKWADLIDKFRRSVARYKRIKIFNGEKEGGRVYAYDKSKLVFLTVDSALSGIELARSLRNKYKIELEMASANYALAMTGAGDSLNAYSALSQALFEIDSNVRERNGLVNINLSATPQKAFEPCEVDALNTEFVDLEKSLGRVIAENVWAYPPGCPLICKGEVIDQEFVRYALCLYEYGVSVESEHRRFPDNVLVLVRDENL